MTRAERRHRRQRAIAWWIDLYFRRPGYGWERDNLWFMEPGRFAKKSSLCSCHMCRAAKYCEWRRHRKYYEADLEGYGQVFKKYNRIMRGPTPVFLRRGGKRGTRV
jgi:hypothetical protein